MPEGKTQMNNLRTLGRSGLVVSPFALGTMTFGAARWGTNLDASREIFNSYVDSGGNFVDTANAYSNGRSEEMVGAFIAERKLRDQVVVGTKAGFSTGKNAQLGGNGARHLHNALHESLRRLQTDYVDLYWVHVWDSVTPPEELLETMSTFVRSGKIRYWGFSNTPAWYVSKVATLASVHGLPGPIAMQYFYSLVNRDVEDEHLPLAREFGMGFMPWSPLAYGLLSGKYDRSNIRSLGKQEEMRLNGANPFGDSLFTDRNWKVVQTLNDVASEVGQSAANVALSWVMGRAEVTSTLIGVSRIEQLKENFASLDFELAAKHRSMLDAATIHEPRMLYSLFTESMRQHAIFGGSEVS
jgi:aryl-alcohol dehydrogenase-like predicted oxidoreductase